MLKIWNQSQVLILQSPKGELASRGNEQIIVIDIEEKLDDREECGTKSCQENCGHTETL